MGVLALESYLNKHPELQKVSYNFSKFPSLLINDVYLCYYKRGIRAHRLVGQNSKTKDDDQVKSMSEAKQKNIVEMFKRGEFNLMVATDIAQESGHFEMPECQYVIRYEFVSNVIGTVSLYTKKKKKDNRFIYDY